MSKQTLTQQDLMEIEMIYKTQVENGARTIQLNAPSFQRLLEAAKTILR